MRRRSQMQKMTVNDFTTMADEAIDKIDDLVSQAEFQASYDKENRDAYVFLSQSMGDVVINLYDLLNEFDVYNYK